MMGFSTTMLRGAAALLLFTAAAQAEAPAARDPLIEGARQCTQNFPIQERQQAIPNHLLAAISSTETGRWHKGLGMALPWPWTINVDGKGYYFNSKAEAIAQTQRLLAQGKQSIDVGCMQVNLKHHATAFRNLNEAFDPATNVAYAAKFLHDNYADLGDWIKATAAYHSRTPKYGSEYLVKIERSWNSIVSKVALARANQGLAPQADTQPMTVADARPVRTLPAKPMNRIASTHDVRSIKVSGGDRRGSEVMVVRAQPVAQEPIRVADAMATNESSLADVRESHGVAIVTPSGVDSAAAAANSAATGNSSKFVFAN